MLAQSQEQQYSVSVDSSNVYEAFIRKFIKILKGEVKYEKLFITLPLEASSILLAAKLSMEEKRTVEIDDLPESISFDGNEFLKEYRELRLNQWANK